MFQFLNPSILFALSASIIPLIIHLLNKRKFKEIQFSTIHFLKEMVRKEMRRLRLRQWLLLLIRTLIILFLVLAFARPTLSYRENPLVGRAATEVIIILDNSMSLNSLELTGNLLEKIRQWWFQMEPLFQLNDRISIILGVEPLQELALRENFSSDLWQKIAKEIQPGSLKGNLTLASLRSYEILHDSELPNKEIYYVSDFQKNGIDGIQMKELSENVPEDIKIFLLPVFHQNDENVSVDSVKILNQLIEKNQSLKIEAYLQNQDKKKYLNSMVSLVLNGNRIAQKNCNIPSGEVMTISFETILQSTGYVTGFIECENDALLEDNRYHFNFYIPEQSQILHIVPSPVFNTYLPAILKPVIDQKIFLHQKKSLSEWSSLQLYQYDIIILEGLNEIPEGLINRLDQYIQSGKPLLVIPGENLSLNNYNKFLKRLNLGRILSREGQFEVTEKFVPVGTINWSHPIFEGLFDDRKALNPIHFYSYYRIRPDAENQVIIHFENKDIYLLEGPGPCYLLASPVHPGWTNIIVRGFVVPLFYRVIYYSMIRNRDNREQIHIGESFSHIFPEMGSPYQFKVKRPTGWEEKITPLFRGSDVILQVDENSESGTHKIEQAKKLIFVYSVNHLAEESIQEYFNEDEVLDHFSNAIWITDSENLVDQIELSRFGRELWPYILGIVLILLIIELLLGYTTSRKQKNLFEQDLVDVSQA
jgi:hypothetical protein